MSFDHAFEQVVMVEGGYSNTVNDHGGATTFGVTERVARANGYYGQMQDMDLPIARAIYKRQYWDLNKLSEVDAVSTAVAHELFDTGVNMGTGFAARTFQRALNVLNQRGKFYPDVEVDGAIGPMTVQSFATLVARRGDDGIIVMLRVLNALQGHRYVEIAENDPTQEDFEFGWFLRRVAI